MSAEKEIVVSGEKAPKIVEALNTTSCKILKLTYTEPLYISTIAKRLNISEPYISEIVKELENLRLINIKYEKGERGIRKIVSTSLEKIIINLKDEDTQPST